MKTIIFSDTHLTRRFSIRKFLFLLEIIKDADRVIINGDFWEKVFTDFDGFVNSKWKLLFPLLKSKQTIYIYGNHDPKSASDSRVNLFSNEQAHAYRFSQGGVNYLVTHGHTIRAGNENFYKFRITKYIDKPIHVFNDLLEWLLVRLFSHFGRAFFLHRHLDNFFIRRYVANNQAGSIVVCGHTHLAFFIPGHRYINLGSIRFGQGSYLVIEDSGAKLVHQRY